MLMIVMYLHVQTSVGLYRKPCPLAWPAAEHKHIICPIYIADGRVNLKKPTTYNYTHCTHQSTPPPFST